MSRDAGHNSVEPAVIDTLLNECCRGGDGSLDKV